MDSEKIIKYGTILAVLGLAVIILLLFSQVQLPVVGKPSNWIAKEGIIFTGEGEEQGTCDDACYYQKALQDPSYCEKIGNATLKEACYENWVDEKLEYCLKTSGKIREECIYSHAQKENNIEICSNAENKTACRIYLDKCYQYENAIEIGRCLAFERNNYTYCVDDSCYFDFALLARDKKICEKITLPARKTACISILDKKDHCGELAAVEKDLCWQIYAIESNDKAVCFNIKESTYALDCFAHYAAKEHDLRFCDDGGFVLNDLWECYKRYSLESGDLAGCDRIYNKSQGYATTYIYTCYADYAKKYGDPSACEGIRDLSQMWTCYEGAIIGAKNIDYTKCAGISVSVWKNRCYTEYAKYNNDPTKCEYITTNENEKQMCYDAWRKYNNVTK